MTRSDLGPVRWNGVAGLYHELANLFPTIEGAELVALTEDIRTHGVREPIVVYEGQILDGRNRHFAARTAGVNYPVVDYVGGDPLGFVLSLNLHRRHLSESQRAMVGARIAKLPAHRPSGTTAIAVVTQPSVGAMLNVSVDSIQRAAEVQARGEPELIAAVEAGHVSVSAAAVVARMDPAEQRVAVALGPAAVRDAARTVRNAGRAPMMDTRGALKDLRARMSVPVEPVKHLADDILEIIDLFGGLPSEPEETVAALSQHARGDVVTAATAREIGAWFFGLAEAVEAGDGG